MLTLLDIRMAQTRTNAITAMSYFSRISAGLLETRQLLDVSFICADNSPGTEPSERTTLCEHHISTRINYTTPIKFLSHYSLIIHSMLLLSILQNFFLLQTSWLNLIKQQLIAFIFVFRGFWISCHCDVISNNMTPSTGLAVVVWTTH